MSQAEHLSRRATLFVKKMEHIAKRTKISRGRTSREPGGYKGATRSLRNLLCCESSALCEGDEFLEMWRNCVE